MITQLHNCITQDSQKWITTATELFEMAKMRAYYEAREKKLKDELIVLSEHKNSTGGDFMFVSISRPGAVDYSSIPLLKDMDLTPYRKEDISIWKLTKI